MYFVCITIITKRAVRFRRVIKKTKSVQRQSGIAPYKKLPSHCYEHGIKCVDATR